MMVRSNNCSDDLPKADEVFSFIKDEKAKYGEMVDAVKRGNNDE